MNHITNIHSLWFYFTESLDCVAHMDLRLHGIPAMTVGIQTGLYSETVYAVNTGEAGVRSRSPKGNTKESCICSFSKSLFNTCMATLLSSMSTLLSCKHQQEGCFSSLDLKCFYGCRVLPRQSGS